MHTQTKNTLENMTSQKALELLIEGNQRFMKNQTSPKDLLEQMESTSNDQYPFAVILGCIDSRVPPELVFDLGIGDVFSIRIAGNFVNEDILGSMEFATKGIGSKHILVLGHTSCGAIQGAYDEVELGNFTSILNKLKPAVTAVRDSSGEAEDLDLNLIAEENVKITIQDILDNSPIIKELVDVGEVGISGAMYDVATGEVKFLS
jgi:carbonic anhydrase